MNMPEELVDEILLWVQVKPLVRFKSVCKRWQSLIESQSFIANHAKNQVAISEAKRSDQNSLVIRHSKGDKPMVSVCSVDKDDDDMAFVYSNQQLEIPISRASTADIVGVCNGLICICNIVGNTILWNPAIRDVKHVPKSSIKRPGYSTRQRKVGFGFDSCTNDYKVVQFVVDDQRRNDRVLQFEIYSLATNSWRKYDDHAAVSADILKFGQTFSTTIYRNVAFAWFAKESDGDREEVILSFDMRTEVFHKTLLPLRNMKYHKRFRDSEGRLVPDMFTYYDSLALVYYHDLNSENAFEIWTIKHLQGGRDSWRKMFSVNHLPGILFPHGIRRKTCGDLLLILRQFLDGELFIYDSSNGREIKMHLEGIIVPAQILNYTETLVSVTR